MSLHLLYCRGSCGGLGSGGCGGLGGLLGSGLLKGLGLLLHLLGQIRRSLLNPLSQHKPGDSTRTLDQKASLATNATHAVATFVIDC